MDKKIPDLNLEPPSKYINIELQKRYMTDDILLSAVLGQNVLFIVQHSKKEFEELYPVLITDIEKSGLILQENQKKISHFYKLYEELYGKPFNPKTFDYTTVELVYSKTILNEIARHSASLKDQYMLAKIDSCLMHYDKVYVQIGGRHAVVWQPALENIIGAHD